MLKPALMLAALISLAGSAQAGERYRDRYAAPPPPAPTYPAYGTSYGYGYSSGPGYATAPQCDATCYGVGYDWNHGYGGNSGGYAYPAYGYGGGSSYPSSQRMDPWAGYNGGFNNGYW